MKTNLGAVVDELKFLKSTGVDFVYVQDSTLSALKTVVERISENDEFFKKASAAESNDEVIKDVKPMIQSKDLSIPNPTYFELPSADKQTQWNWLREKILSCPVCNAHVKPGKKVVFGVGNINADIFFCGEAPGADEEVQGEPFVGKAGQLLTKIIQAMGLERKDVYIGNIMNWRPEMPTSFGNRPPTQQEMNFCLPYLKAQLAIVKPKVIIALGATAVNGLLGPDPKRRMGDVRGKWNQFEGIPLMITFHPSYLLRNQTNESKRTVWVDMLQVMEKIRMTISEKQKGFFLG